MTREECEEKSWNAYLDGIIKKEDIERYTEWLLMRYKDDESSGVCDIVF